MEYYQNHENNSYGVLVSGGFGAGWSTWNKRYKKELACDKRIIEYFLENMSDKEVEFGGEEIEKDIKLFEEYIESLGYSGVSLIGLDGLGVEWVPFGNDFFITEYDGQETLHVC